MDDGTRENKIENKRDQQVRGGRRWGNNARGTMAWGGLTNVSLMAHDYRRDPRLEKKSSHDHRLCPALVRQLLMVWFIMHMEERKTRLSHYSLWLFIQYNLRFLIPIYRRPLFLLLSLFLLLPIRTRKSLFHMDGRLSNIHRWTTCFIDK